jgi:hypothetical protein
MIPSRATPIHQIPSSTYNHQAPSFQSSGPQSGGPQSGGPQSGGPQSSGPQSSGPQSGGPLSGGPQSIQQYQNARVQPPQHPAHSNMPYMGQSLPQPTNKAIDSDMDDDEATVRETLQYINSSAPSINKPPQREISSGPGQDPIMTYDSIEPMRLPQQFESADIDQYDKHDNKYDHVDNKPKRSHTTTILIHVLIGGIIFAITSIIPVSSIAKVLRSMRIMCPVEYLDVLLRTIIFVVVFFLAIKSIP